MESKWENQSNGAQYSSFFKFADLQCCLLLGQKPFGNEQE